ncbi:MAG: hypothetical protein WC791_01690 [Candidatus Paceibacterota bacterium]|jgi:hypothetical protein
MYQKHKLLVSTLVASFLCGPLFVFAQTSTTTSEQTIDNLMQSELAKELALPGKILEDSMYQYLQITTTPKNPGPNTSVNITVESYLTDLDKAYINWSLNNKVVLKGLGERHFGFQNGSSGETTNLTITIATNGGQILTRDLSWTPVGITLFWQADTYTPPFYKGKPLLSPEAAVTVIATPDNTDPKNALGAGDLVYTWQKEGTVQTKFSGYGKNSFSFTGPIPLSHSSVSVKVSSIDDTINSEATASFPLSNPFVLFYENHPLLGVQYNQSFSAETYLSNRELSLSAEPFFFSNNSLGMQTLRYNWSVNGNKTQNNNRDITLRNDTGAKGSTDISLTVTSLPHIFQAASRELRINFAASDATSKPIF